MQDEMKKRLIYGDSQAKAVTLLVRVNGFENQFVCFREKIGKPLLYYRKGDLSVPAGHVEQEKGEKPATTCVRELAEETGLVIFEQSLNCIGTYCFMQADQTMVHVTSYETEISGAQWEQRSEGVELFSLVDLNYWPNKYPELSLRITTIYPTLVFKFGRTPLVQQLLDKYPLPSDCAIHVGPPIYIDGWLGK